MQAYKKEELQDYFLAEEAKTLYSNKYISKEQLAKASKLLVTVKTNGNLLLRIAFFLLGSFLYSSIAGTFSVFSLVENSDYSYKLLFILYSIIGLIGAELLARNNYFRQGLDDAFILGFQLCFSLTVGFFTENVLLGILAITIVGLFCTIRYLHTLSALIFCCGIVAAIFYLSIHEHALDTIYLPFVCFILAILIYASSQKIKQIEELFFYTETTPISTLFSLLLAYFSMNYMVVREMSQSFMNLEISTGKDIPFAIVFYLSTFLIPVFYIAFGLYKRERIFLWTGLFTFGYSIFTIRYYYSLLPLEYALLLGGSLLFAISYFAIRYWKDKTSGITFQADRSSDSSLFQQAQQLIITTQVTNSVPLTENKMPFGGGEFSGGGAGENF